MAEADVGKIIDAFAEKGWNLYEEVTEPHLEANLRGPVDNLVPGTDYAVLPAIDDPSDARAAYDAYVHAVKEGKGPKYGEYKDIICYICLDGTNLHIATDASVSVKGIRIPFDIAARRVREMLSSHERGQDARS